MTNAANDLDDRESGLNAVLRDYLLALDAGRPPDRQALLRDHPDLAAELAEFFADDDFARRVGAKEESTQPYVGAAAPAPRNLGDYEILERIGRGGMGVVYKARQRSLNKVVALKMIRSADLASPEEVRRFLAEARVVAQFDHPHIVPVYAVGKHKGRPYFTMKLIEGGNLSRLLTRPGLGPREAARLVEATARAVHHFHQHGILHRDLKPANVLLDASNQPLVADFGLAKRLQAEGGATPSDMVAGTPDYMAPEQATGRGRRLTTAVDVWALGAILYALLTGRPPFHSATLFDTLMRIIRDEPTPPSRLRRGLPRDLEAVCLKCLQKEPDKRYAGALELADDLRRFQGGKPPRARRVGPLGRGWRWARRRPFVAAAVLCAAAAVGAAGVFAQRSYVDAEVRRTEERRRAFDDAMLTAMGGDVARADEAVRDAEARGVSAGRRHVLRGLLGLQAGKMGDAVRELEQAVALEPKDVTARALLAAAYGYQFRWGDFQKTLKEIDQPSLTAQATPEDRLFTAYALCNVDPIGAQRMAEEAYRSDPHPSTMAHLIRGEVRLMAVLELADFDQAGSLVEKAIQDIEVVKSDMNDKGRVSPVALWDSLWLRVAAAEVYTRLGRPEERDAALRAARADADALAIHGPALNRGANPIAAWSRWIYFRYVGLEGEMLDDLRQTAAASDDAWPTYMVALALYRRGAPGDLRQALDLLAKRPDTFTTDPLRPLLLKELGESDEAVARACDDLVREGASTTWQQRLFNQTILRLVGRKADADRVCQDLAAHPEQAPPYRSEFRLLLLKYSQGGIGEKELLADVQKSRSDQCLAHYWIGVRRWADGDRDGADGAREHFKLAAATHVFNLPAYDLSFALAGRLGAYDGEQWPAAAVVNDVAYPEGAAFFRGKLYYVGYGDGTVNRWDGKRSSRLWKEDGSGPCAVAPVGKDELLVACYDRDAVVRIDADGKTLETIDVKKLGGAGPNDFVVDSRGGAYFSASGAFDAKAPATGMIFYRDPDGKVRCVAEKIHYANGLALADGGKTLLAAETLEGRILKFAVREDGGLSESPAVWKRLSDIQPDPKGKDWYVGPDGLKTDSTGNVYICQFGAGRVLVTDAKGDWIRTLSVPYKYVTNVALDPDHEGVVYVTAAKDGMADKPAEAGGAVYEIPNR